MFDTPSWLVYTGIFFLVYWAAVAWPYRSIERRNSAQNIVIALGSVALYALGNLRAALLLVGICGALYLYSQQSRLVRAASAPLFIAAAVAYLGFVKYWGLAADQLGIGWKHQFYVVGISFYVFTMIGYVVDTAYRRQEPLTDFTHVTILLSFWPHLAAGPILRLKNIREHILRKQPLDAEQLKLATLLIAGGLAKKLYLADNFGTYVNANLTTGIGGMNGLEGLATLLGFTAQIYFDFSGYSDVALGAAALLGFRLPANFNYPYLASSLGEFWTRWHISLSTWFRDFLYIPLGGSRRGNLYINLLVVFVISGLWHGAALHFALWGLIHGTVLCLEKWLANPLQRVPKGLRWGMTFSIVTLAWAYFRLDTSSGNLLISKIFQFNSYKLYSRNSSYYVLPLLGLLPFLAIDHLFRYHKIADGLVLPSVTTRQMGYVAVLFLLALLFSGSGLPFIYIKF